MADLLNPDPDDIYVTVSSVHGTTTVALSGRIDPYDEDVVTVLAFHVGRRAALGYAWDFLRGALSR